MVRKLVTASIIAAAAWSGAADAQIFVGNPQICQAKADSAYEMCRRNNEDSWDGCRQRRERVYFDCLYGRDFV